MFKSCALFINCKSEINAIEIDNAKDLDVVMPMYNLIEYNDNYSKASGSFGQYYRDKPNDNLTDSESFQSKIKITGNIPADGNTRDNEIIVPSKYSSSFRRTLEIPLINCEINLVLTWSSTCVITNSTTAGRFPITGIELVVSIQDNAKLLQQLKSGFKRTINWNKYQSEPKSYAQNHYLNHKFSRII